MCDAIRVGCIGLLCLTSTLAALGQTNAQLKTSDTELVLEAGPTAPRMMSLSTPRQRKWDNRNSETLIPSVEISEKEVPVKWSFNHEASQIGEQRVAFVYDSMSPHLRLTWEWQIRQQYGPIEHEIRIENLDNQEIWIPMQDSLAFNWQVDPSSTLEHLFVEKGANTPSPVGTHEVPLTEGYQWTGTSSTYGDIDNDKPREVIPYSLVENKNSASGWYAGIEFSGRTRVSLKREKDSLQGALGLDPDPRPFRTRLEPGEVFETPVVFLGGFRDGAD